MIDNASPLVLMLSLTAIVASGCGGSAPPALDYVMLAQRTESGTVEDIVGIAADGSMTTNLTQDPARDLYPTFAPGRSRFAFMTDRDGNMEIYRAEADGTNPQNLTQHASEDVTPDWSAGNRIVFASNRDGDLEIYKMEDDGERLTQLTANGCQDGEPAWSPDSSLIAYTSDCTPQGNFEIFIIDSNGQNQRQLTDQAATCNTDPAWSPDGMSIAFEALEYSAGQCDSGESDIWIISADGITSNNVTGVLTGPEIEPAWSPDGSKLAFVRFTNNANLDIYTFDFNAGLPQPLTTALNDERAPAWVR